MKTLSNLLTDFTNQTGGTTPTEYAQAQIFITDAVQYVLGCFDWDRNQVTVYSQLPLKAFQEKYPLPRSFNKMVSCRLISSSGYPYTRIYYYIDDDRQEILIYPTPSTNFDYLEYDYSAVDKNLSLADYSVGTLTNLTRGSTIVTATGALAFTNNMVGSYLFVSDGYVNGISGDGNYYQIVGVPNSTTLMLGTPYEGFTVVGGAVPYYIGQVPVIDPLFQELVVIKALQMYCIKNRDFNGATAYNEEFETRLTRLKSFDRSKSTTGAISGTGIFTRRY